MAGTGVTLTRKEAARRIAKLIGQHMTSLGWSEERKDKTVREFTETVNRDLARSK